MENTVIVVAGPTATGKTRFGIELALRYGLEVTAIKKGKLQDAGIQKGMILLQVNDKEMRTVEDFEEAVKTVNQSSNRTLWIRAITPSGRRVATAIDLGDEKKKK